MRCRRIAIIGAGPVGLEAALYGATLGHDVRVFERGRVAENVRSWGHVVLFSSWRLNHSTLGAQVLESAGVVPADPERFLTGREFADLYLDALARCATLRARVQQGTRVVAVGRDHIGKGDKLGGGREQHAFRLLIEQDGVQRFETADVVLDCSGTYGHHDWLGNGNLPALGERRLSHRIDYTLRDIEREDRETFAGARVLLVGTGYSAATALAALHELPKTRVIWVGRASAFPPYKPIENDPLPQRAALGRLGNRLALEGDGRVEYLGGTSVEALKETPNGEIDATLSSPAGGRNVSVDRVLAHVGFSPDNSLYRQLQIHECYATSGPMNLATTLLGADSGDCLTQTSPGAEALRNPEPDFFILGAKSYGRNSSFLMRLGIEQVRDVYTLIEGRRELDLYLTADESVR